MALSIEPVAVKRRPGRPKGTTSATTAKQQTGRVAKTAAPGAGKKAAVRSRKPLNDITNTNAASDTEEVDDDFDILSDDRGLLNAAMSSVSKPVAKTTIIAESDPVVKEAPKPKARRGRPRTVQEEIPETQPDPEIITASSKFAQTTTTTMRRPRPTKREVVPETQSDQMIVDESLPPSLATENMDEPTPRPAVRQTSKAPSASRQPSLTRRRGVSGSDTERGGNDTTLRRKVGDLTKKLESLELKYENLHTIGVRDAEINFDKLKKQTETRSQAADTLISSLRAELAAEQARSQQLTSFRSELQALQQSSSTAATEKKALSSQLSEARAEVKALQAKLAAARSSSADAGSGAGRVPGSAVKQTGTGVGGARTILVGTAEGAKEAQKRHLKEELYRDLTGLLIMDVKRREAEEGEEDVFDCIQTGRNGSLHFHLAISVPGSKHPAGPAGAKTPGPDTTTFDETEFQYEPRLNEERDRELLDILPDYLTEDICFPRSNAARFYARVVDCLMKRVEVVQEEGEEEGQGEGEGDVTQVAEE